MPHSAVATVFPESTALALSQPSASLPSAVVALTSSSPLIPKRIDFDALAAALDDNPAAIEHGAVSPISNISQPFNVLTPSRVAVAPPPSVPRRTLIMPVTPPTRPRMLEQPYSVPRLRTSPAPLVHARSPHTPTVSPIYAATQSPPADLGPAVFPETHSTRSNTHRAAASAARDEDMPDSKAGGLDDEEVFALNSKGQPIQPRQSQQQEDVYVDDEDSSDVWAAEVMTARRAPAAAKADTQQSQRTSRGRSMSARPREPLAAARIAASGSVLDNAGMVRRASRAELGIRSRSRSVGKLLGAKPVDAADADSKLAEDAPSRASKRNVTVPKSPNFSKMSWERRRRGDEDAQPPSPPAAAPAAIVASGVTASARASSKPRVSRGSVAAPAAVKESRLARGSSAAVLTNAPGLKPQWR
jgi:hypothetical protein